MMGYQHPGLPVTKKRIDCYRENLPIPQLWTGRRLQKKRIDCYRENLLIPQLWTGRRHLFHIILPLLRHSLIHPVLPAPMSFRRTVEPPGTYYRALLHL